MYRLVVILCTTSCYLTTLMSCATITVCKQHNLKTYNWNNIRKECVGQTVFTEEKGQKGERGEKESYNKTRLGFAESQIQKLKSEICFEFKSKQYDTGIPYLNRSWLQSTTKTFFKSILYSKWTNVVYAFKKLWSL